MTDSAVFPIKLIKNWKAAAFIDGLLTEEKAIIFLGVALYIAALAFTTLFLVLQIRNFYNAGKKILALSTVGLLLISIALLGKILIFY